MLLCNHRTHLVPAQSHRLENFISIRHQPYSLFIWKEANQADLKSSDLIISYSFLHIHSLTHGVESIFILLFSY